MKKEIIKFLNDLTKVGEQYSMPKVGALVAVCIVALAGLSMVAVFILHAVTNPHQTPDYIPFGTGLGLLGVSGGGAAWLHSKSTEKPS